MPTSEDKLKSLEEWAAHFVIHEQGTDEEKVIVEMQLFTATNMHTSIYQSREVAINLNYHTLSKRVFEFVEYISDKRARENAIN